MGMNTGDAGGKGSFNVPPAVLLIVLVFSILCLYLFGLVFLKLLGMFLVVLGLTFWILGAEIKYKVAFDIDLKFDKWGIKFDIVREISIKAKLSNAILLASGILLYSIFYISSF